MFSWIGDLFMTTKHEERKICEVKVTINKLYIMREEERKQAEEAKERTQRILHDALKKKESLLVEDPEEFGDNTLVNYYSPLLTTDMVKELIRELEKVTFAKNTDSEDDIGTNAYVYPRSEDRTIYLCAPFFNMDPESRTQQGTIIHEVSHFLGYGHTVQENSDIVKKSPQSMLCPLTAYSVASALTSDMDHPGTYRNGSYSCCGETSRDTVCEESWMADKLSFFRRINQLLRKKLQKDTAGEETHNTSKVTDISGEDTFSSGEESDTSGEESDTSGEESDTSGEESDTSGEESDTSGEESDTSGEELDTSGIGSDTSFEDTSDEEADTDVKTTDTTIVGRIPTDQLNTATNRLIKQTKMLKKQTKMLKKQTKMLKKQTKMLKKQTKMLKTQAQMVETQDKMVKTRADMVKTRADMVKTRADMVKTRVDMLKTQIDMMKTRADMVKAPADMVKT